MRSSKFQPITFLVALCPNPLVLISRLPVEMFGKRPLGERVSRSSFYRMGGPCSLGNRLVLALILGSLAAGCGTRGRESEPVRTAAGKQGEPFSDHSASRSVRLALLRPSADTDMAALEGVLTVDGPCLYITGPGGLGSRTMPAFSLSNVRWDGATQSLVIGSRRIASGHRVRLTGGSPPTLDGLDWVQQPPPSCDKSDLFMTGAIEALLDTEK